MHDPNQPRDLAGRVRLANTDLPGLEARAPGSYPLRVVRGEGARLFDQSGRELIDGGQHLGACEVGHGRTEIAERIAAQAAQLAFAALDHGIEHPLAAELAEALAPRVPVLDPVFLFGSSGSEAVETAIKVARVHHARRGEPERTKVIGREGSYHGATYGAMSATGLPEWREPYGPLVGGFRHVVQPSPPHCGLCGEQCTLACAEEIGREIEREGAETVAAVIGEPVAIRQAVKVPHPGYWRRVREICDELGVLLIVDEVFVGFGRTGRLFASEHWGLRADILTLAKGITSGYVPLGATVVSGRVYESFAEQPLTHISTYSGHPVACAAGLANLELIDAEGLPERAAGLGAQVEQRRAELEARHERVLRSSGIGLLHSIEVGTAEGGEPRELALDLLHGCLEQGLVIRCGPGPERAVAYFFPPLVIEPEEVDRAFDAFDAVIGGLP